MVYSSHCILGRLSLSSEQVQEKEPSNNKELSKNMARELTK